MLPETEHIRFENRTLTLYPQYVKNENNSLYPVHLVPFEICYEYLQRFRANPELRIQLQEFEQRIRDRFNELSFIEEKDIEYKNSRVRLDNPEPINSVEFGDVEQIVENIYITDLLFIARLFFRLDFVNRLITCQKNVLEIMNFEVQQQHVQMCMEIARKSRETGITKSRLFYIMICCLIKFKYTAQKEDNTSHYCCPYPFALDAIFNKSSGEREEEAFVVELDTVRYIPPYNVWTEEDLCNGLINQQFPAGVLFNHVEPQLMLAQLSFNEILDAAKAATDTGETESQTTFTMTNEEFEEIIRTQCSRMKMQEDSRQIQMKQMLAKFRELKQLCEAHKCEYTSYGGDYLFFTRPAQIFKLKPEDRKKITETLKGQRNIKFEEAQSACSNFIKDYVNKKDSRKLKKQKEKKRTQDKWLNEHVKDDWYVAARERD